MKKVLIKTLLVCVGVLVFPFVVTLFLTSEPKETAFFDYNDFEIYSEKNGVKEKLDFNDYLVGVIAANMPAGYHLEALKAQAVIVRTYALHNILLLGEESPGKKAFTTSELGLSYIDLNDMEEYWTSDEYLNYFTKLENSIYGTDGEVISYDGELILPMFFYTGSGHTRNASEAWDVDVPYLTSVSSKQDVTSIDYLKITEYDINEIIQLIDAYYDIEISEDEFFKQVEVIGRDGVGYVTQVEIGDEIVSGEEFAKVIGLNSNHFYIEEFEGLVRIICTGVGHGIGLSQYGANAMASDGYSYNEILAHYYPGTRLASYIQKE